MGPLRDLCQGSRRLRLIRLAEDFNPRPWVRVLGVATVSPATVHFALQVDGQLAVDVVALEDRPSRCKEERGRLHGHHVEALHEPRAEIERQASCKEQLRQLERRPHPTLQGFQELRRRRPQQALPLRDKRVRQHAEVQVHPPHKSIDRRHGRPLGASPRRRATQVHDVRSEPRGAGLGEHLCKLQRQDGQHVRLQLRGGRPAPAQRRSRRQRCQVHVVEQLGAVLVLATASHQPLGLFPTTRRVRGLVAEVAVQVDAEEAIAPRGGRRRVETVSQQLCLGDQAPGVLGLQLRAQVVIFPVRLVGRGLLRVGPKRRGDLAVLPVLRVVVHGGPGRRTAALPRRRTAFWATGQLSRTGSWRGSRAFWRETVSVCHGRNSSSSWDERGSGEDLLALGLSCVSAGYAPVPPWLLAASEPVE
eukprot:scaffold1253_cov245-Pinguiococcus_pyrenoidosus.AAC.15